MACLVNCYAKKVAGAGVRPTPRADPFDALNRGLVFRRPWGAAFGPVGGQADLGSPGAGPS